jgi:hypothetical protein
MPARMRLFKPKQGGGDQYVSEDVIVEAPHAMLLAKRPK